jgi:hypothetical protein
MPVVLDQVTLVLAAAFWTPTFWKGHFKMHFVVKLGDIDKKRKTMYKEEIKK